MTRTVESDDSHHFRRRGSPEGQAKWQQIVVRHASVWHPPTDVYRVDARLVILIEIGGMRDSDFEIVLEQHLLTVSGVRQNIVSQSNVAYHQMEIQRGAFRTEIFIPWNVHREEVSASYRDGLLKIELPQAQPKSIQIINLSAKE